MVLLPHSSHLESLVYPQQICHINMKKYEILYKHQTFNSLDFFNINVSEAVCYCYYYFVIFIYSFYLEHVCAKAMQQEMIPIKTSDMC